jgi:hypothetical protein
MENRDNVRERFAVPAQQKTPRMEAQNRTVSRRRGGDVIWPVAAVMALGLALALPHPVQAETLRCGAGDVGCLIAAINEANTNGQQRNTIRLEAGTYTLTAVDNDTDGPNGLPSVTSTLTIRGAGAETTVIERDASAPAFRLLHVEASGTLTLNALTLQGGNTIGSPGPPGGPGDGGGIFSSGRLTVTHSTLSDNTAAGGVGGSIGGPGDGGGIFSSGTLTVTHSTVSGNTAAGGQTNGTGFGGSGSGGGIFSSGTLTVTNSILSGNTATGTSANQLGGDGSGGGIFSSSSLTVTNSILSDNKATGVGAAVVSGHSSGGGIFSSGTLTVTNSILSDNMASGGGGPPGTHTTGDGGGIFSIGITLTVTHSTIRDNTASGLGSFVAPFAPGTGGGIFFNSNGTLIVTNSTLSGNTAATSIPAFFGTDGGGIRAIGTIIVTNSTLSGNRAVGTGGGIAVFNSSSSGTLTVTNSTLSGNTVSGVSVQPPGGGLANQGDGPVALQNTILAQNSSAGTAPDCAGLITSLGNNLMGDPTGCTITLQPSDLTGDPGLSTFTDNSRPGNGHFPLLPTSQAIDAGSDTVCPSKDQLGQRRIGPCDIGAIRFRDQDDRRRAEEDDQHEADPEATVQASQ